MAATGAGTGTSQIDASTAGSIAQQLGGGLVERSIADVTGARERARLRRLRLLAVVLGVPFLFLWVRILSGAPFNVFALPHIQDPILYVVPLAIVLALGAAVAMPLLAGRSPHVVFTPEQLDVTLDDVKGLDHIVDEVVKTLNTFLGYARFREQLGGRPRRGLLFEGAPGTGKTHLAKAMAREAGVPFLFVSATSFQSMWYGATARKIRSYFKQLRATARRHGGAIGFIEEIDAIATTRGGLNSTPVASSSPHAGMQVARFASSEGTGGVVNELLVQMQSFDSPTSGERVRNAVLGAVNSLLPEHRQFQKAQPAYHNILLIAATNRADALDPALLRPGRFDRRLEFELPAKQARRELVDYFLSRKAHHPELDDGRRRDELAAQTFGYTPVMIEHLLDEALVVALRNGRDGLNWRDVQESRLSTEVGLKHPAVYTPEERRTVATHEAGHATMAWLAGTRRLELLSIVKRKESLGLLAHGDLDEVYTRSRREMYALVDIAMGGLCAEELFFGEAGTGPGGDLAYATKIACEIVGSVGMAGSLVSLAAVQNTAFNDTNLVGRVLADPVARPQVDALLRDSKMRAREALGRHRGHVEALRDALLARDELVGEEILAVLDAVGAPQRDVVDGLRVEIDVPADVVGDRDAVSGAG